MKEQKRKREGDRRKAKAQDSEKCHELGSEQQFSAPTSGDEMEERSAAFHAVDNEAASSHLCEKRRRLGKIENKRKTTTKQLPS